MSNSSLLRINCRLKKAFIGKLTLPCRIGESGFTPFEQGREGDRKTPLGTYTLRWGFYRADRLPLPPTNPERPLAWRFLHPNDGWCDDPQDPAYNHFIRLPSNKSHEKLWREDGAYDIVLVIGHNDSPPQKGRGSAVFIHIAQPDNRNTLGCVAFTPEDMVQILPLLQRDMQVDIYA